MAFRRYSTPHDWLSKEINKELKKQNKKVDQDDRKERVDPGHMHKFSAMMELKRIMEADRPNEWKMKELYNLGRVMKKNKIPRKSGVSHVFREASLYVSLSFITTGGRPTRSASELEDAVEDVGSINPKSSILKKIRKVKEKTEKIVRKVQIRSETENYGAELQAINEISKIMNEKDVSLQKRYFDLMDVWRIYLVQPGNDEDQSKFIPPDSEIYKVCMESFSEMQSIAEKEGIGLKIGRAVKDPILNDASDYAELERSSRVTPEPGKTGGRSAG